MTRFILMFALLLLAGGGTARADQRTDAVDSLFQRWDRADSPGMTVAVFQDGKPLYQRGYGMANVEFAVPNGPDVVYPLASNSKQFTAFAIHLLAQDGKLSLDDDVRKFVPELHDFGAPITLRMLLHHTSGLREITNLLDLQGYAPEDALSRQRALALLLRQRELNFAPGTRYIYCNSNYQLLAEVVARASSLRLGAFLQARVFAPLGMTHSSVSTDPMAVTARRAMGYGRDGSLILPRNVPDTLEGAAGVNATVADIGLWLDNFESTRVGGQTVIDAMLEQGKLGDGTPITYASGLHREHYRGLPFVEHSGHNWGYKTDIIRFPAQRLSIVILANTDDAEPAELVFRIADIYLKDAFISPPPKPAAVPMPEALVERYTGTFEIATGTTLRAPGRRYVFRRENFLGPKAELAAASDTEFFAREGDFRIRFLPVSGGGAAQRAQVLMPSGDVFAARRIPEEPAPVAPQAGAALAGDYWSEELAVLYRVIWRDGKLWMRWPRGEAELRAGNGGFRWRDEVIMTFTPGGTDFRLSTQNQRLREVRFTRVKLAS